MVNKPRSLVVILTRPWLHFLVLGSVLFTLQEWLAEPPVTVLIIPPEQIATLRLENPDSSEREWAVLLNAKVDEEIFFF